jgi:hypothetical protein
MIAVSSSSPKRSDHTAWGIAVGLVVGLVLGAWMARSETIGRWLETAAAWFGPSSPPVVRTKLGPVKKAQLEGYRRSGVSDRQDGTVSTF